ncbi:uncharacterized protein LOC141679189 [Apium graveolens]|uniref:uncharacterized protein LOC141679189 n=1 Tax=Apium graveolens TaxID=4045 RepID=UPI003D7B0879
MSTFPASDIMSLMRQILELLVLNSDRGIVCVIIGGDPFYRSYSDPGNTYLRNPATKHYKHIPQNISDDSTRIVGVGFGFDPINYDFKVIRVVNSPSQSEVYSANLNTWRKVGHQPMDNQYVWDFKGCINGLLCWTQLHYILTFDLTNEMFTCVTKLPSEARHACITDFNDSNVVLVGKGSNDKINLWRPNDIECLRLGGIVEASWTLVLSNSIDTNDVPVHSIHSYFNTGDILLRSDEGIWYWYNSVKKKAIKVSTSICLGEIYKYTESLVSITGFEQLY